MEREGSPAGGRRRVVGALAVLLLVGVTNRLGAAFQVAHGVALVFPASGVVVGGALLLGWPAVAASFVALVATAWGAAVTVPLKLAFAASTALQGAVPLLVGFPQAGPTRARLLRFLVRAAGLNVLLSTVAGIALVTAATPAPEPPAQIAVMAASWFLGDVFAVVLLAVPVVVLLRPGLLLDGRDAALVRRAAGARTGLLLLALLGAVMAAMETLVPTGVARAHWLAVFLIAPVLVAAGVGGVGAALVANGVAGTLHVVETLRLVHPAAGEQLFQVGLTGYSTLALLTTAAIAAGLYAGRAMTLVAELDRQRAELQRGFENVVTALAAAIEAKDPSTRGHVQQVAHLAVAVGRRLGLDGARIEVLRYAAILHDVGKIGVPETILNKAGRLTRQEREAMERHVELGVEILESVELLAPAIPIIRAHQERWDGRREGRYPGYLGLAGEEIPLEARIIAVVDAYDAMTSDRPYRRALPEPEAVAELQREAGRQFDPAVVEALVEVLRGAAAAVSDRYPLTEIGAG